VPSVSSVKDGNTSESLRQGGAILSAYTEQSYKRSRTTESRIWAYRSENWSAMLADGGDSLTHAHTYPPHPRLAAEDSLQLLLESAFIAMDMIEHVGAEPTSTIQKVSPQ
jgi:hypothetical protein